MVINKQKQTIKPKSPKIDSKLSKKVNRKEYYAQRYQTKKQEWHQWYLQRKTQQEQQEKENQNKLYQANSIKVLMSLKEYTELNQEKHQKWLDFAWTLDDCQDKNGIKIYDIVQIQRLEQLAENLTRDYYETAQKRSKSSWNTLTAEEQSKLIKYWGREKARKEQELAEKLSQQEQIGESYEKDIELAKFHEERGKIKCSCYSCAKSKEIQQEIKEKMLNENENQKEQCPECKWWVKELDGENGICKKCVKKYE